VEVHVLDQEAVYEVLRFSSYTERVFLIEIELAADNIGCIVNHLERHKDFVCLQNKGRCDDRLALSKHLLEPSCNKLPISFARETVGKSFSDHLDVCVKENVIEHILKDCQAVFTVVVANVLHPCQIVDEPVHERVDRSN